MDRHQRDLSCRAALSADFITHLQAVDRSVASGLPELLIFSHLSLCVNGDKFYLFAPLHFLTRPFKKY
jgi:hypothetical protein